jgi:hypothetical protein
VITGSDGAGRAPGVSTPRRYTFPALCSCASTSSGAERRTRTRGTTNVSLLSIISLSVARPAVVTLLTRVHYFSATPRETQRSR